MTWILLVIAFALFVLAALNVIDPARRLRLVAAGLACWVLAELFPKIVSFPR